MKSVLWGTKWDVTRNRKTNYLERVVVQEDNVHPRLHGEAKLAGALYCKRLRADKVIVISGEIDGNGRSYRMLIPDCGDIPWGCFVNVPERKTLEEMEWVGNQSVYEDIPNFAAEGNQ